MPLQYLTFCSYLVWGIVFFEFLIREKSVNFENCCLWQPCLLIIVIMFSESCGVLALVQQSGGR